MGQTLLVISTPRPQRKIPRGRPQDTCCNAGPLDKRRRVTKTRVLISVEGTIVEPAQFGKWLKRGMRRVRSWGTALCFVNTVVPFGLQVWGRTGWDAHGLLAGSFSLQALVLEGVQRPEDVGGRMRVVEGAQDNVSQNIDLARPHTEVALGALAGRHLVDEGGELDGADAVAACRDVLELLAGSTDKEEATARPRAKEVKNLGTGLVQSGCRTAK